MSTTPFHLDPTTLAYADLWAPGALVKLTSLQEVCCSVPPDVTLGPHLLALFPQPPPVSPRIMDTSKPRVIVDTDTNPEPHPVATPALNAHIGVEQVQHPDEAEPSASSPTSVRRFLSPPYPTTPH